jgi:alkylhydroperoxidase family enzyme
VAEAIEELRAIAASAPRPRTELAPYLEKVRTCAYTVSDEDLAELKRAGIPEDEIFEATVTVAVVEGLRRLDAARRVIG